MKKIQLTVMNMKFSAVAKEDLITTRAIRHTVWSLTTQTWLTDDTLTLWQHYTELRSTLWAWRVQDTVSITVHSSLMISMWKHKAEDETYWTELLTESRIQRWVSLGHQQSHSTTALDKNPSDPLSKPTSHRQTFKLSNTVKKIIDTTERRRHQTLVWV